METNLNFIPKDDQGRPVAKPPVEWLYEITRAEAKEVSEVVNDGSEFHEFSKIQSKYHRIRINLLDWLQAPFHPERDLVGDSAVFAGWKSAGDWKGWNISFPCPSDIVQGLEYKYQYQNKRRDKNQIWNSFGSTLVAQFFEPQTRAQFITLFKIATGEYLPLTAKAVKDLTE